MKIKVFLLFIFLILLTMICCTETTYTIKVNEDMDFVLGINESVDYTKYFTITNNHGDQITVTKSMLDLSKVNVLVEGTFSVILDFRNQQCIATFTVIDMQTPLEAIEIEPVEFMNIGSKLQLVLKAIPEKAVIKPTFGSSNTSVLTVDSQGLVTAKSLGEATITVRSKDVVSTITINVVSGITSIEITDYYDIRVNDIINLGYITLPVNEDISPTWSVSDESVAIINSKGELIGVGIGVVTVTLTYKEFEHSVTIEVNNAPINAIYILARKDIEVGETHQLEFATDPQMENINPVFLSSDSSIILITTDGMMLGVSVGTCVITVSYGGRSQAVTINVKSEAIKSVAITNARDLVVGETLQLEYKTVPEVSINVTFGVDNQQVASISKTGLLTGLKVGVVVVTITAGIKSSSVTVNIRNRQITDLKILNARNLYIGETLALEYSIEPSYIEVNPIWESTNPSVISITDKGVLKALSKGESRINLKIEGVVCYVTLTVFEEPLQGINITNPTTVEAGNTLQITYTTLPTERPIEVVYASSNDAIATVNSDGLITAIKAGKVTITLICDVVSASFVLEVQSKNSKLLDALNKYKDQLNYNFDLSYCVYQNEVKTSEIVYSYDGYNIKINNQGETDYLLYYNNQYYYVTSEATFVESSYEYLDKMSKHNFVNLKNLYIFEYVYNDLVYSAVDVNMVCPNVLGNRSGEVFNTFTIKIANGLLTEILVTSIYNYTNYKYQLTFSNYNGVDIDANEFINEAAEIKSIFNDKFLNVTSSELEYFSTTDASGFINGKGVSFDGSTIIQSTSLVCNVNSVTVVVSTNTQVKISVKVGNSYLLYNNATHILLTSLTSNTPITFSSDALLDGLVEIELETLYLYTTYVYSITLIGNISLDQSPLLIPFQSYDYNTLDKGLLVDLFYEENDAIGLTPVGTYPVLVIPVQFSNTTVTQADLTKLDKALNGDSESTGWESVSSYYQKSSYGKLNMTYHISNVYIAPNTSDYYKKYSKQYHSSLGTFTEKGYELILLEALAYLEPLMDLTIYDYDRDGVIDGVYVIYSAPVDYNHGNFYWAYVTNYIVPTEYNKTFDNMDVYYYLFAGFDFLDEDVSGGFNYRGIIPGLKINAGTFIHETGHMLGLDDYYDYQQGVGSDEGLGGADMMDWNVGDHNAYSKMMLGWISPIVVNQTKTITINSLSTSGDFLLIFLDYNQSYFCEFLIIDLYTATDLNELHASLSNTFLYSSKEYGVRIYHVSNDCSFPFSDSYNSITTYNNSASAIPLIKLIEADGESKFTSSGGYAKDSDLWDSGATFSSIYINYKRNDGKKLNFDIFINSANEFEATITVTFKN